VVTFLIIFIVVLLALAFVGWLADRRAAANRPDVTPGPSFLPGDIKYESRSGNVRVDAVGKFIKEQPYTATLIALGIGWLLGRTRRPL